MNSKIALMLAGLLGGIAGGAIVAALQGSTPAGGGSLASGDDGADLAERVARIEAAAAQRGATGASLQGQGGAESEGLLQAAGSLALTDAQLDALALRVGDSLKERIKTAVEEANAAQAEADAERRRANRPKRMSLADAARELPMTGGEEDAVRDLLKRIEDKAIGLLADDEAGQQAVRDDLALIRKDPSKAMQVMPKYIGKVVPKMGEFIALEQERQAGMREILGPERASKLTNDYAVEEMAPFGMGGSMRMELNSGD